MIENMDYKEIKFSDILVWCINNNQKAWLSAKLDEIRPVKPTKKNPTPKKTERSVSFMEVKLDFCKEFFPEKVPVAKTPKPKSMREQLLEAL